MISKGFSALDLEKITTLEFFKMVAFPDQSTGTTKVNNLQCFIHVHLFDVRALRVIKDEITFLVDMLASLFLSGILEYLLGMLQMIHFTLATAVWNAFIKVSFSLVGHK